jgi:hypothetical protein
MAERASRFGATPGVTRVRTSPSSSTGDGDHVVATGVA